MRSLDALFTPAEFAALAGRDLSATTCVVFDVLRATSTMLQALSVGATAIYPVSDIPEALARRTRSPGILLAGERHGLRIRAAQTGGTDFDFGNSPREFTPDRIAGREIAMTTTNGTLALRACAHARHVLVASFGNLAATTHWLTQHASDHVLLVCAGTGEQASYEDTLGAGALADRIWPPACDAAIGDAAQIARNIFRAAQGDLLTAVQHAANGRRLLAIPELAADVALCLVTDRFDFVARLGKGGAVNRL
ncbi:MAG TPA: 2-phosphosulfolactate phosphatase [Candidatus Limnocylindria bacterium]|jgi:2-phosphosulfolactate phosphatase|nr:2-phosphosulfolactate phosphatase [Candidatus Limnocylindria bacterium]